MSIDSRLSEEFSSRHIGPSPAEIRDMLAALGQSSLDGFVSTVVPEEIRTGEPLTPASALTEAEALMKLKEIASKNKIYRSLIGMGYADTITPPVIQRNILENPGWYTQYTPYQAEIAQGRLEALLNFQTMVMELTGMEIANASLLDEATAAAEAMALCWAVTGKKENPSFFVADNCHPQTLAVLQTRATPLGITILTGDFHTFEFGETICGALVQYPASNGVIHDYRQFCERAHQSGALVVAAADILALTLIVPPAEFGADVAIGSTQRFGIPMGYGGPHAAYFATKDEYKRSVPGRIIGASIDSRNKPALRMALQTREQHIRREKATSNICTAQVLLAVMAGMYAVYHGPNGLTRIATRTHLLARKLGEGLKARGYALASDEYFDTVCVPAPNIQRQYLQPALASEKINIRWMEKDGFCIALDELSTEAEVDLLLGILSHNSGAGAPAPNGVSSYQGSLKRTSKFLTHAVFNSHQSETSMLRYIRSLEEKDLSLTTSMIPLGSCTMKLNATSELFPVTWPEFGKLHPFAPIDQAEGYHELFYGLESMLASAAGFPSVSLQPNSGAQGEYTGLLVIRQYHRSRGEGHRNVCLIPTSAHGTNPASAVMAGMNVVLVQCDSSGNIRVDDLETKAREYAANLAAFMVTYPSTHGVFEAAIKEICAIVHRYGGQVYMDGANMNAQVGLCSPGGIGADVCHINLHKTFCIPHGGGGPGMGPIAVASHLAPFLPSHPVVPVNGREAIGPVSAAPWGSASILVISWMYIAMMGDAGLQRATSVAMLSANYMADRLAPHYPVLYRGANNRVAHEFILDLRGFKATTGIEVEDVTKRLMDYGFHAPTASFPVPGTLMIEPTESEDKSELDRYCDALIAIREEIADIESGTSDRNDNPLKNAPHTSDMVVTDTWVHAYSREQAAFPSQATRHRKFWPPVGRINSAYGDKNLVCSCLPLEEYAS